MEGQQLPDQSHDTQLQIRFNTPVLLFTLSSVSTFLSGVQHSSKTLSGGR